MVVMVAGPRVILLEEIQENQPGAKPQVNGKQNCQPQLVLAGFLVAINSREKLKLRMT